MKKITCTNLIPPPCLPNRQATPSKGGHSQFSILNSKFGIVFSLFTFTFSLISAQPSTFNAHGISGGGAQYSPSINPANSSEIYSSTDMTDMYHSTNGGASWKVVSLTQLLGGVYAMVQFTNNNNIRYCQSEDHVSEVLIPVKSTDAGVTSNLVQPERMIQPAIIVIKPIDIFRLKSFISLNIEG